LKALRRRDCGGASPRGSTPMPPRPPPPQEQPELFRPALANLADPQNPLVRLAGLIDWDRFASAFGPLYRDGVGRPGLPTRPMVGLHLLKHTGGLSDEAVCARFLDSPYVQLCCGEARFRHRLPLDRSSMTRWRRRIGPERLGSLLAETPAAARRAGAVEPKHLGRATIDTTVQPEAATHPTDGKLLHRGVEVLGRLAREHGIAPRQSYARLSRNARREVAKLIHRGRHREAERVVRRMRTWGSAASPATSAAGSPTPRRMRAPPSPRRSTSSPACRAGGAKTAAVRRSTPCTPPRRSASARAKPRPAASSA
jgi:transposase, IS5 family